MFVVDTNILLYAANGVVPEHGKCKKLLAEWRTRQTPWHLTWGIAYEFIRVSTHPKVFPNPLPPGSAWEFLDSVFTSPGFEMLAETECHAEVAREVFREVPLLRGNLVFDAKTAILMREHGIKVIYTRDTHFHKFPFLKVVDPLTL